jgi:hypothetical protein
LRAALPATHLGLDCCETRPQPDTFALGHEGVVDNQAVATRVVRVIGEGFRKFHGLGPQLELGERWQIAMPKPLCALEAVKRIGDEPLPGPRGWRAVFRRHVDCFTFGCTPSVPLALTPALCRARRGFRFSTD